MKKMLVCLLMALTVGLFAQDLQWVSDYGKAIEMSRKTGKPVFTFFTGSDWCGWCVRLDREILSKKNMIQYLNKNFVLYKADFPRKNPPQPLVRKKNSELMKKYGVRGFPTIIITDANGNALEKTGYMRGGPSAMMRVLDRARKK